MAIKTYAKGVAVKLSNNFKSTEFDCNGSKCCSSTLIDEKLVEYLQKIRDHFGKAVNICSSYRCKVHNGRISNASKKSKHMLGMAADIKVSGVKPSEVAKFAESIGVLGIGLYDTDKDGHFVHIDTRNYKCFWFGHAQAYRSTFGGAATTETQKIDTIKEVQKWANKNYKSGLVVDGIYGANTKKALVKILQTELNKTYNTKLVVDGIFGAKTKEVCPTLKTDMKNNVVGVLQAFLVCNGFTNANLDKDYGSATMSAVKSYQNKNGLSADGIAGKNTFTKLCS